MYYVHYDTTTGQILSKLSGAGIATCDGFLEIESFEAVDTEKHKVDVVTREVIPIPTEELPYPVAVFTIKALAFQELLNTDFTQLPDTKFTPAQREDWRVYRKNLRDVSKQPDAEAMLNAWPLRPDGTDAAAHLRLTVKQHFTRDKVTR